MELSPKGRGKGKGKAAFSEMESVVEAVIDAGMDTDKRKSEEPPATPTTPTTPTVARIRAMTHLGHAPTPPLLSTSRKTLLSLYTSLSKNDTYTPHILIDQHTAKEVAGNGKLFVYGLPAIHVKGKVCLVPINLLFSMKGDGQAGTGDGSQGGLDNVPVLNNNNKSRTKVVRASTSFDAIGFGKGGNGNGGSVQVGTPRFFKDSSHSDVARQSLIAAQVIGGAATTKEIEEDSRVRSITESLFGSHSPPSSPISPSMQIAKISLTASHHNDEILSFAKFRMLLPMVLGGTGVTRQVEDIVWVRTIGVPQYIRR